MHDPTSSLALFATIWAVLCILAGALVTDAMLRNTGAKPSLDPETPSRVAGEDVPLR